MSRVRVAAFILAPVLLTHLANAQEFTVEQQDKVQPEIMVFVGLDMQFLPR